MRGRVVRCAGVRRVRRVHAWEACACMGGVCVHGRCVRCVRAREGHAGSPEVIITNYYIIIINYII